MSRPNYRVDAYDRIQARLRAKPSEPRQYRRICCFCHKDLGPTGSGFNGDSHGACDPWCPEAVRLGWDKV